jgi:hypothetical protein
MSIAPPGLGLEETFGIVREGTYGTAGTPGIWFKADPLGLKRVDPVLPVAGPSGATVMHRYNATRPRSFKGTPTVGGPVTVAAEWDDIGHLLSNAIATPAFGNDTPVSGAYTHTYTLPAALPAATPISLTCARLNGVEDYQFTGCMIQNFEMRGVAGQIVSIAMDIIGQGGGLVEADDTDTEGYSTAPWMEFHQSSLRWSATPATVTGSLTAQASGKEATDWTFRLENNLRTAQAAGNGVRGIREPVWDGYRKATISFNRDFFDDQFFNEYMSTSAPTWYSTIELSLTTAEYITGTTPYSLKLYMPYAVIDRDQEYGGGAGIESERITFEAGTDGTTAPLTVTLINGTGSTPYGS